MIDDGSERQRPGFWKRIQGANQAIWWISFLATLAAIGIALLLRD